VLLWSRKFGSNMRHQREKTSGQRGSDDFAAAGLFFVKNQMKLPVLEIHLHRDL